MNFEVTTTEIRQYTKHQYNIWKEQHSVQPNVVWSGTRRLSETLPTELKGCRGLYAVLCENEILYIGETTTQVSEAFKNKCYGIYERLLKLKGALKKDTKYKHTAGIKMREDEIKVSDLTFLTAKLKDADAIKDLEKKLIQQFKPKYNFKDKK